MLFWKKSKATPARPSGSLAVLEHEKEFHDLIWILEVQIMELTARELALQQFLRDLAKEDSRFTDVFTKYEHYQAESLSRMMILLEDRIGPAAAAEADKDRKIV
jgi:hypothetical protein